MANYSGGSVVWDLDVDNDKLSRGLQTAQGEVDETAGKVEKRASSMGKTLRNAFLGVSAVVGAAGVAVGGASLKMATDFEQAEIAFSTMLGSADKAQTLLGEIADFAASTPFELTEIQSSSKSLLAFGLSAEQIIPSLRSIGDIAAGVGVPIQELAVIYGKARTAGTLYAEDINQLTERGVPIIAQFAKQFNVAEADIKKLTSEGKIGFEDLQEAFQSLSGEGGTFFNLMEKQSESLGGQFSNLQDGLGQLGVKIGTALLPAAKVLVGFVNSRVIPAFERSFYIVEGFINLLVNNDLSGSFLQALGQAEDSDFVTRIYNMRNAVFGLYDLLINGDITGSFLRSLSLYEDSPVVEKLWNIREGFLSVLDGVRQFISFATPFVQEFFRLVGGLVDTGVKLLVQDFKPAWEQLKEAIVPLVPVIEGIALVVVSVLGGAILVAIPIITGLLRVVVNVFTEAVTVISGAVRIIQGLFGIISGAIYGLITGDFSVLKRGWENLWSGLGDFFGGFIRGILGSIAVFTETILKSFSGLFPGVKDALRGIKDALVQPFEDAFRVIDGVSKKIKGALDQINPFHRNSPSLVDNVKRGVGVIEQAYKNMALPEFSMGTLGGELALADMDSGYSRNITINNTNNIQRESDIAALSRQMSFQAQTL